MSRAFLRALGEASLSGGILILSVLVLRQCFQNRVSRRVWCLMWDVTLARLSLLVEIPSPVSIRAWLPMLVQKSSTGRESATATAQMPAPGIYLGGLSERSVVSSTAPAMGMDQVLILVWLGVALLLAVFFLWGHLRSHRVYASSLPCGDRFVLKWLEGQPLRRRVQVRTSDQVAAPLTYGIFRPVILLPAGMEWAGMTCVLEHEFAHIRRFDTLRKTLLAAVLCLHWFNPLAWAFYVLANRDMELCCDEAAIRTGGDREGYALALLAMEERRGKWCLSGSHFSQNALEERVKTIMKQKHYSIVALITVLAVISCTVTVFASAAPENRESAPESSYVHNHYQAVENDVVILSDGITGERQYSVDGGKSWMNETQYQAQYGSGYGDDWQVEWWTAEDYALWLEEEKQTLQSIIGEKGYNSTDGWFIWDQEKVDEAIALYESILEDIRNGALYSKTITDKQGNVVEDAALASDGAVNMFTTTSFSEGSVLSESDDLDQLALLEKLRDYGIEDQGNGKLTYEGQRIRTLVDGVPAGDNGYSIRYVYSDDGGTVDVHTLRSIIYHPNGSYDPMGELVGAAAEGDKDFDQGLMDCVRNGKTAQATTDVVEETNYDEAMQKLEQYLPFGLNFAYDENGLSMNWQGKPVHSLYDTETEIWYANNLYGTDLGDQAVDLETVYRNGKLWGLKKTQLTQSTVTLPIAIVGIGEDGQTLEEIFAQYRTYGLEYTPRDGNTGSLTWNGARVKAFLDWKPDDSVFSYSDPDLTDGLTVRVEYGRDGKQAGLYAQ